MEEEVSTHFEPDFYCKAADHLESGSYCKVDDHSLDYSCDPVDMYCVVFDWIVVVDTFATCFGMVWVI